MEITKKQLLILGGLLAFCVLIVLYVSWDKDRAKEVDHQLDVAEKDLEKQEKRQEKTLKDAIGVAVPTHEAVKRLLELADGAEQYESLMEAEYGKKYTETFLNEYLSGGLISSKDTIFEARVKEAYLYNTFTEDEVYSTPLSVIDTEGHLITEPYGSTLGGFKNLTANIKAGYLNLTDIEVEGLFEGEHAYRLDMVIYPEESMTVKELEEKLDKVKVVGENVVARPFNDFLKEDMKFKMEGNTKNLSYLDIFNTDWSETNPEKAIVYKGSPLAVSYYWTTTNPNAESITFSAGTQTFDVFKIEAPLYLPYTD